MMITNRRYGRGFVDATVSAEWEHADRDDQSEEYAAGIRREQPNVCRCATLETAAVVRSTCRSTNG